MMAAGISPRRGIMAAHLQPAYQGHPHGELEITEWLTQQTLLLPLFHQMTEAEQGRVVTALREEASLLLRGRPRSVGSQPSNLHERENGITPFECLGDNRLSVPNRLTTEAP
jgi:DegT/DnrJ/EryC1/StrS aminotransferase family